METVEPAKHICLCNSVRAVADNISKKISTSRSAAVDGHWEKWDMFYRDVALITLTVS